MTNLPEDVDLDLDALERDPKDVVEPFKTRVAGRTITMLDPEEIDWQDLLLIVNPVDFMRFCMSDEDQDHLVEQRMPGWKLNRLMEAYMKHYRLKEKMAQAQREQERQARFSGGQRY